MSAGLTVNQVKGAKVALARDSLYYFARLRMPTVYTESRAYLRELCDTIQRFIDSKLLDDYGVPIDRLIINGPPRHGKTVTIVNAVQWALGHDPTLPVIATSYNEDLSGRFARYVRDGMQETSGDARKLLYSDIFPEAKIKRGDASYQTWSLEGQHFSFLASSPGGTLTGTGARLGIIDDLVRSALEAYNEGRLESQWQWYTDTFLSRLESGAKQLIIATRWSTKDLPGRLIAFEPDKWHVIQLRANKRYPDLPLSDADMLAPDILNAEEYRDRRGKTDSMIFSANYDQEPIDAVDRLYPQFKEYDPDSLPPFTKICAYIDTADEGQDYLSGGAYGLYGGMAYMLDVIYTQAPMEQTEPDTARMLTNAKCDLARVESNNGGRGFARNVERIIREDLHNFDTTVEWFHQSENKNARILSNATNVCNCVIMPYGWSIRWPAFHSAVTHLGRSSKWTHDDAPDMLTGIVEDIENNVAFDDQTRNAMRERRKTRGGLR
jgi:predicted phage terminase large subunit-like protein